MGFFDWLLGRDTSPAPAPAAPAAPSAEDIFASLDDVEALADVRVPTVVASRVHRISSRIRETLPRMDDAGLRSVDTYSLMATATDYLPEALGAYLRLPRDWADSRPVENGKTSLMLLIDQLDLLSGTIDHIADAVNTRDAEALIAHGRFLTEKFGTPAPTGNPLNL